MTAQITMVKALAATKGYIVERSPSDGKWPLLEEATRKSAVGPNGTPSFSVQEAGEFLRSLP